MSQGADNIVSPERETVNYIKNLLHRLWQATCPYEYRDWPL